MSADSFNIFNFTNFDVPASSLNDSLPTISLSGGVYRVGSGMQPGQGFTQSQAGGTFGLLRQQDRHDDKRRLPPAARRFALKAQDESLALVLSLPGPLAKSFNSDGCNIPFRYM